MRAFILLSIPLQLALAAPGPQQLATIKPVGKPTPVNPPPSAFSTAGVPAPGVAPFGFIPRPGSSEEAMLEARAEPTQPPSINAQGNNKLAQACGNATPMSDVIFWTTGAPAASSFGSDRSKADAAIASVMQTVTSAVNAAGGQVKQTYNMSTYKGMSIVVPTAMLDLLQSVGKDLGFKIEANGVVSAMPAAPTS